MAAPGASATRIVRRRIQEHEDVELGESEVPYEATSNLGIGGHGFVEKVKDVTSGQYYARKTFKINRGSLAQAKAMLRREAHTIRALAPHPHVIRVHSTYIAGRSLAIILEPVADGGNLDDYLSFFRDLEDSHQDKQTHRNAINRAFGCLATCLEYLHTGGPNSKPIIRHKDIKPKNILIHDGYAILTDFGISNICADCPTTTTGRPDLFTPRYCAPEVADFDSRNRKADVFSLGCVFLEMLAAIHPDIIPETFLSPDSEPYHISLDEIQQTLSGQSHGMAPIICGMLDREPSSRYSANDVVNLIRNSSVVFKCIKCSGFEMAMLTSPYATLLSEEHLERQHDHFSRPFTPTTGNCVEMHSVGSPSRNPGVPATSPLEETHPSLHPINPFVKPLSTPPFEPSVPLENPDPRDIPDLAINSTEEIRTTTMTHHSPPEHFDEADDLSDEEDKADYDSEISSEEYYEEDSLDSPSTEDVDIFLARSPAQEPKTCANHRLRLTTTLPFVPQANESQRQENPQSEVYIQQTQIARMVWPFEEFRRGGLIA